MATAGATSGSRPRQTWTAPAAGAVIGAAFLLGLAGLRPIDPTEIGWVMHFDWVPHYFGWHYFRTEPWHWPPGRVEGYYAPFGTAIGLTDSIPLAAYLFKPLSAWLPAHFQYLGLWWLLSFTLQGAFAARLLGRWIAGVPAQVLGATLFVLLPTLLARVAHAALCSHWLILWTLLIATRETGARLRWREWATIGLLAGMIQPYLAAMALALLGATALATTAAPVARRAVRAGSQRRRDGARLVAVGALHPHRGRGAVGRRARRVLDEPAGVRLAGRLVASAAGAADRRRRPGGRRVPLPRRSACCCSSAPPWRSSSVAPPVPGRPSGRGRSSPSRS